MPKPSRRDVLKTMVATGAVAGGAAAAAADCDDPKKAAQAPKRTGGQAKGGAMNEKATAGAEAILRTSALGFPWKTSDPFLFCVHHEDHYPAGNKVLGPEGSLAGRRIGQDFTVKDGWRMYHGRRVPGFPKHPHRGFETVTVVRTGLLDHSDSLGATARYGGGDVQWLTAGKGINHAEMFPLLKGTAPNPLELFQIWLNLPRENKLVDPYFTMFWEHTIPRHGLTDAKGRKIELTTVAGRFGDREPPKPPPNSRASQPEADLAIWTLKLAPGAEFVLPAAGKGTNRSLYFFAGKGLAIGGQVIPDYHRVELDPTAAVTLTGGPVETEMLLLQGYPLGEPVARHGPFVMNTQAEIQQAYADYRRTGFGGWPWSSDEPVHPKEKGRFAKHVDGHIDRPT